MDKEKEIFINWIRNLKSEAKRNPEKVADIVAEIREALQEVCGEVSLMIVNRGRIEVINTLTNTQVSQLRFDSFQAAEERFKDLEQEEMSEHKGKYKYLLISISPEGKQFVERTLFNDFLFHFV